MKKNIFIIFLMIFCFYLMIDKYFSIEKSNKSIGMYSKTGYDVMDLESRIEIDNEKSLVNLNEIEILCTKMLQFFIDDNYEKALDTFKESSSFPEDELEFLKQRALTYFKTFQNRFGKFIGYEKSDFIQISDSIINIEYFLKGTVSPVRFNFYFYKPKDKWNFLTFFYTGAVDIKTDEYTNFMINQSTLSKILENF